MNVETSYPPNYSEILKHFDIKDRKTIVFTFGDTLHNPGGGNISPDLMAHEETHQRQQGKSPEDWWEKYLADPDFRLAQELAAYRVQYRAIVGRPQKRAVLQKISKDLSGPMYGNIISRDQAKQLIKEG